MEFEFSLHAKQDMIIRMIPERIVKEIILNPDQKFMEDIVVEVRQSIVNFDRAFLVRVFININKVPPKVITVYRTSNIRKYWL